MASDSSRPRLPRIPSAGTSRSPSRTLPDGRHKRCRVWRLEGCLMEDQVDGWALVAFNLFYFFIFGGKGEIYYYYNFYKKSYAGKSFRLLVSRTKLVPGGKFCTRSRKERRKAEVSKDGKKRLEILYSCLGEG